MSFAHFAVMLNGKTCGLAVTCGERFMFFTDSPALAGIDGRIFDTIQEIEQEVRATSLPPLKDIKIPHGLKKTEAVSA